MTAERPGWHYVPVIPSSQPWHGPPPGPPYPPYYPAQPAQPQPGPGQQQYRPIASFGRRLAARVLDYILIGMGVFMFFLLVSLVAEIAQEGDISEAYFEAWAFMIFFGAGPVLFFYDWLFNAGRGKPPGKAMVGIRVVRKDGGRLSQGQAAGRAALFGLPQSLPCVGSLFSLIDCLSSLGDAETMLTLHDRAAGTVVVRD
ncbi:hypothetical protein GCM10027570_49360 [Streptomonospora sediminis]